jgi:DNA-binding MarR family transcriptional regulator
MAADHPTLVISRLHRALERADDVMLSLQQYRVLAHLTEEGARASQLARRLAVTKPTVTSLTDSLVERGLVTRHTEDGDRRVVTVSITAQGRTAVTATGVALRAVLDDVVSRCADPPTVYAALDDLGRALDAWWEERLAAQSSAQ